MTRFGVFKKVARVATSWPAGFALASLTFVDEIDPPHFVSPSTSAAFAAYSALGMAMGPSRLGLASHASNLLMQGVKLTGELSSRQQMLGAEEAGAKRTRVVVLGSGWGAMSFVKNLQHARTTEGGGYIDLTVVSPRGYFLYTPLLPGAVTGSVEVKSIVEAVRTLLRGKGKYYEAMATEIDPVNKVIKCRYPRPFKNAADIEPDFVIPYDVLVVGVGAVVNTFGTPGVQEHAYYLKEMEDALKLKTRIRECFELAALPDTPEEVKRRLLTFVVVGGGPTGVETAAEICDLVHDDVKKVLPVLSRYVSIKLVETRDHILSMYDKQISAYTEQHFKREGIDLMLQKMVLKVEPEGITMRDAGTGKQEFLAARTVVWATGIKPNPLIEQVIKQLPKEEQGNARAVKTDGFLRVRGASGAIYALGDASTIEQDRLLAHAEALFDKADANKDGKLSCAEIRGLMAAEGHRHPQLSLIGTSFKCKADSKGLLGGLFGGGSSPGEDEAAEFTPEQFRERLGAVDASLRTLPATAQVANQEGRYLANLFNHYYVAPGGQLPDAAPAFKYKHMGSFAYVGADRAVMELTVSGEKPGVFTGWLVGLSWKGLESWMQISARNKYLVSRDWVKAKLFGRDLSDV